MFGIGLPELIVLILILLSIILPIWITRNIQKKFPNKKWLGITLSIIFCPWGHLYLKGASWYIISLLLSAGISKGIFNNFLLPYLFSPILMWYRFNKLGKLAEVQTEKDPL